MPSPCAPPPISPTVLPGAGGGRTGQEAGKSSPSPSLLSQIPKYKGVLAESRGAGGRLLAQRTLQGRMVPELRGPRPWRRTRQHRVTPTLGTLDETRPIKNS